MKCPNCAHMQKYKEGMVCHSCGYQYALNPKTPPMMTDMAMKNCIDRVSGLDTYHFTFNQLASQLVTLKQKKEKKNRIGCAVVGVIFGIIFSAFGISMISTENTFGWLFLIIPALIIVSLIKMFRKTPAVNFDEIESIIENYRKMHPISKLVDGQRFANGTDIDASELLDFAPERILIVQHNDVADMLILNGFHMERNTLVLSAEKYPSQAFHAYQNMIAQYPDIPIALMHDASEDGLRMKARLVKDPDWMLEGKTLDDLGLSPKDVEKLKTPVWIPARKKGVFRKKELRTGGDAMKSINEGYTMPLDISPPKAIIGAAGLALLAGAPLLSAAFFEEQMKQADGTGVSGGGFGYG